MVTGHINGAHHKSIATSVNVETDRPEVELSNLRGVITGAEY